MNLKPVAYIIIAIAVILITVYSGYIFLVKTRRMPKLGSQWVSNNEVVLIGQVLKDDGQNDSCSGQYYIASNYEPTWLFPSDNEDVNFPNLISYYQYQGTKVEVRGLYDNTPLCIVQGESCLCAGMVFVDKIKVAD